MDSPKHWVGKGKDDIMNFDSERSGDHGCGGEGKVGYQTGITQAGAPHFFSMGVCCCDKMRKYEDRLYS